MNVLPNTRSLFSGFGFNELDNLISNFDACRRDRSSLSSLCVCVCVFLERLTSISAENMRVVSLRLAKPCLIENLAIVIIFYYWCFISVPLFFLARMWDCETWFRPWHISSHVKVSPAGMSRVSRVLYQACVVLSHFRFAMVIQPSFALCSSDSLLRRIKFLRTELNVSHTPFCINKTLE